MSVKLDKKDYRILAKARLKSNLNFKAKSSHYKVQSSLLYLLENLKVKNILLFTPLAYEPDILRLRSRLAKKYNLYLPLMVDKSLKMVKLRMPFKISKFGVRESQDSNAVFRHIDLAIIPVIGVDGNMARIGHGMGYYDRFFTTLSHKPIVIFVQNEDFFTKDKICESHDIRCDFYLTPRRNYLKKGIYDRNFSRTWSRRCRTWSRVFCI